MIRGLPASGASAICLTFAILLGCTYTRGERNVVTDSDRERICSLIGYTLVGDTLASSAAMMIGFAQCGTSASPT